jgi:hypothetical protein
MSVLINEWQLQGQLNQALQHQHRADFALWLALLSPAAEELAPFYPPQNPAVLTAADLYQQLAVPKARDFAMQTGDVAVLDRQQQGFVQSGLAQWRLLNLLAPAPTVVKHDARKLSAEVLDNLSPHSLRRLQGQQLEPRIADATGLYEVLADMQLSA